METKVILPTIKKTVSSYYDNVNKRPVWIEEYDKYEFNIVDALKYMMDNNQVYMFEGMILHNVNMRNRMREVGARALVDELRQLNTPNERLDSVMDMFVNKWEGRTLGDIDIQVIPTEYPFTVDGIVINGLNELLESSRRAARQQNGCMPDGDTSVNSEPQYFIEQLSKEYPKFDIYDSCDDRCYRNFLIRKRPITYEENHEVHTLARHNYCALTEDTPAHLLPIVYYVGNGGFMLVAERHNPLK